MESLATSVGMPRGRGVPARSGVRVAFALTAAAAVLVGVGVPGAGALGAGGADAATGAAAVVTGTVERLHLDDFSGALPGGRDEITFVATPSGAVQVPASTLEGVDEGTTVSLGLASTRGLTASPRGGLVSEASVAQAQDPAAGADVSSVQIVAEPAAGAVATGTGTAAASASITSGAAKHQVLVVVVTPSGGTASSVDATAVADTVNGGVDNYWTTVSGGAVGFTATAYPYVITTSSTPCVSGGVGTSFTFWDEVASKVHWTQGAGKHLVVYFKGLSACGGIAGLGTVGSGVGSGGEVWTNGYNATGVLGHELGHNLGLGHSQELDCTVGGVRVIDAAPQSCSARSYWDTNDIMAVSWQNQGYLNASHLRYLGLLGSGEDLMPTSSGQVTVAPLSGGSGLRALTLADAGTRYVVEFRQAVGLDAWMATSPTWGAPGVTVRREFDQATLPSGSSFPAHESFVLDGDPATADASFGGIRTVFPVGYWIDLDGGRLGLRIVSEGPSGAVIDYRIGLASTDPRYAAPARPVVAMPHPRIGTGGIHMSGSSPVVPARWFWTVTTPSGTSSTVRSATAKSVVLGGTPGWRGTAYRAIARAVDGALISAVGRAQVHYTRELPSSTVHYSTGWSAARTSSAVGHNVRSSTRRGAKVVLNVRARGVALLLQRSSRSGRVRIYLDGHPMVTINLRSARTGTGSVWSYNFRAVGKHTVTVVNLGSGSRGRVRFDGFVSLI
jgi:hypothetical protein